MHELTKKIDWVGNIRSGKGAVLKSTNNMAIFSSIRKRITFCFREFQTGAQRGSCRFGTNHPSTSEKVSNILGLMKMQLSVISYSMNAKKKGKRAKVLESKFSLKVINELKNEMFIRASNKNVVNIHQKIDEDSIAMKNE